MGWVKRRRWWVVTIAAGSIAVGAWLGRGRTDSPHSQAAAGEAKKSQTATQPIVQTCHPTAGGIVRTTVQPGSVHSFQSAELFAKLSGYLKTQAVDIGSIVKRGQLLAELDVPELIEELERDKAELRQAQAEVHQAKSSITSAQAEQKAAEAYIAQTKAAVKRSQSELQFREKQYQRIRDLHTMDSVEARLVDEQFDQFQAAQAARLAAESSVVTAEQQAAAAAARVARAEADLTVAEAKVQVAQADVRKAGVLLGYTKIVSPYDGVITSRSFHPGEFIRSADQGDEVPLLCVDRTDLMRVVVLVPDRDVPYVQPGDPATVLLDALPNVKLAAKVARVSASEDPQTRTMRVEIDMPNSAGLIRDGMYGQVEIELDRRAASVTIPSACLVGGSKGQAAKVFVIRDGKAAISNVKIGKDTGAVVEIESGLSVADQVVVQPPPTLVEGSSVIVDTGPNTAATH